MRALTTHVPVCAGQILPQLEHVSVRLSVGPSDALTRLLRLHVAQRAFPLADVIETRVALERSSVVLACRNARPQNLARMRASMAAIDEPELSRERFNQLDIDQRTAPVGPSRAT